MLPSGRSVDPKKRTVQISAQWSDSFLTSSGNVRLHGRTETVLADCDIECTQSGASLKQLTSGTAKAKQRKSKSTEPARPGEPYKLKQIKTRSCLSPTIVCWCNCLTYSLTSPSHFSRMYAHSVFLWACGFLPAGRRTTARINTFRLNTWVF